jgi:hypothetical protein
MVEQMRKAKQKAKEEQLLFQVPIPFIPSMISTATVCSEDAVEQAITGPT